MKLVVTLLVGGNVALDFINTVNSWVHPVSRDDLSDYQQLALWSAQVGLLPEKQAVRLASLPPEQTDRAFQNAIKLRASLLAIFMSVIERTKPSSSDLEVLNGMLDLGRSGQSLVSSQPTFEWQTVALPEASTPAALVSLQAAELLTSNDLTRVKQCPGPDGCGWLFIDRSRNQSRKWCSMEFCGGFAKARRFAERHS